MDFLLVGFLTYERENFYPNRRNFNRNGKIFYVNLRSSNKSYIIDARETAPLNSKQDMFVKHPEKSLFGKKNNKNNNNSLYFRTKIFY